MIEIVIDGDVYRALTPNNRLHWRELHRRKQLWKTKARLAWLASGHPPFLGRVRLEITLRRGRTVDPDNAIAAVAAILNGLKSEPGRDGLFVDDRPAWLELLSVRQETGGRWRKNPEVVVRVALADGVLPLEEN